MKEIALVSLSTPTQDTLLILMFTHRKKTLTCFSWIPVTCMTVCEPRLILLSLLTGAEQEPGSQMDSPRERLMDKGYVLRKSALD